MSDQNTEDLIATIAKLDQRMEQIEQAMGEMREVWDGAKGVLAFLKWTAAVGSAVAAFVVWAKDHVKW